MYNVHNAKELTISRVSTGNMREPLRCPNVCLRRTAVLALSTFQQWRSQAEPSTQRFSHFMSFLVCFPSQWIHAAKTDCILSNTLFGKKLWPVLANHITCQADYMCRPNVVDRYFLAPTYSYYTTLESYVHSPVLTKKKRSKHRWQWQCRFCEVQVSLQKSLLHWIELSGQALKCDALYTCNLQPTTAWFSVKLITLHSHLLQHMHREQFFHRASANMMNFTWVSLLVLVSVKCIHPD